MIDCANGAAYQVAPEALWELGAEVIAIGTEPNGFNINVPCGSTAPDKLQDKVRELRADIGIALDGDADRLILVDEHGELVNGDQLMALIATQWHRSGRLRGRASLPPSCPISASSAICRTFTSAPAHPVGDRYVVEHMRTQGCNVGGEQSGHIVLADFGTTGDGLVAALQVMAAVKLGDKPVSQVTRLFTPLPRSSDDCTPMPARSIRSTPIKRQAIAEAKSRLGPEWRPLLVRPSGTEPLIRVMAEGEDPSLIGKLVDELVTLIERQAA